MSEAPSTATNPNSPVRTREKHLKRVAPASPSTIEKRVEEILDYLNEFYFEWQDYPKDNPDYWVRICKNSKVRWEENRFSLPQIAKRDERLKNFIADALVNRKSLYNSIRAYSEEARREKCRKNKVCLEAFRAVLNGGSRVLLLDIDRGEHKPFTIEEFEREFKPLLKELKEAGVKTAYYPSGRGVHLRIILDEPLSEHEYEQVIRTLAEYHREILKGGEAVLTIDTTVSDLARVFRTVGSYNHKNPTIIVGADLRGETGVTEKKKLLDFVRGKEALLKKTNEVEKPPEKKFDIALSEFDSVAEKIADLWGAYYRTGTRQNLALLLAGILKKYTVLDDDQVRELFEKIIEKLSDDEKANRLTALESTLRAENPATITLFFVRDDDGEIFDRGGRLSQFCGINNLDFESGAKTLEKLVEKTMEVLREKGLSVRATGLIGRKKISHKIRKNSVVVKSLEVYTDGVKLVTAKYDDETDRWTKVSEEKIIEGGFRLKKIETLKSADEKGITKYYTVEFVNKDGKIFPFERVKIEEIAKNFASTEYVVMKSASDLQKVFQVVFSILKDKNNIEEEDLLEDFEFKLKKLKNDEGWLVKQKKGSITNNLVEIDEVAGEYKHLAKLFKAMNCIEDDKLLFLLAGSAFSAPLNELIEIKPILWIYGPPAVGKTSSARIFTEKAWGVKIPDAGNLTNSAFRLDYFLKLGSVPLMVDDVSELSYGTLVDSLKSYATGNTTNIRGKADQTIVQYKRTANLIFVSNFKLKLRRRDEAFLDRVIQYEVQEQVFSENCPRGLVASIPRGVFPKSEIFTLIFPKHPKDMFYEKTREIEEKVSPIVPRVRGRRAEFWAKLLLGIIGFRNFLEEFATILEETEEEESGQIEEEVKEVRKSTLALKNRLDELIKKAPDLIIEIEAGQDDDELLAVHSQELLAAIARDPSLHIKKGGWNGKKYLYVTKLELDNGRNHDRQKIRALFERMNSLSSLKKALETLDSDFVELGRFKINGKKITAVRIDAEVAENILQIRDESNEEPDDEEIKESVKLALDLMNEQNKKKIIDLFVFKSAINENLNHHGPLWGSWKEEEIAELLEKLAKNEDEDEDKIVEKIQNLNGEPTFIVNNKKKFLEEFPQLLKNKAQEKLSLTETPYKNGTKPPIPPKEPLKEAIKEVASKFKKTEDGLEIWPEELVDPINETFQILGYDQWVGWTIAPVFDVLYYLVKDGVILHKKLGSTDFYYITGSVDEFAEKMAEKVIEYGRCFFAQDCDEWLEKYGNKQD